MSQFFILLQRVVPQHALSRIVGIVARARNPLVRRPFIAIIMRVFKIDLAEAERDDPADYASFNDFFTRTLKPHARPVAGEFCSPADGKVSAATAIDGNQLFQAKGMLYSLEKLVGGTDGAVMKGGSFTTIYLAPSDYHRVHSPVTGRLVRTRYIPGKLFSVNQATASHIQDLFAVNERLVMWFETADGPVCVIMVGAMIVAAIRTVWRDTCYPAGEFMEETFREPVQFGAGDEIGQFEMGSTVIVLSPKRLEFAVGEGDRVLMGQNLLVSQSASVAAEGDHFVE